MRIFLIIIPIYKIMIECYFYDLDFTGNRVRMIIIGSQIRGDTEFIWFLDCPAGLFLN